MTTTIVQYLHTSYHPDREFVDGLVIERNLGERTHSRLQGALIERLHHRSKACAIQVFPGFAFQ